MASIRRLTEPDAPGYLGRPCVDVGDRSVDGQAATTYKLRNGESSTDAQVHILQSNGLLLGQTLSLADGSVVRTRYDYADVQPPADVK
jgi:hypothetical protein